MHDPFTFYINFARYLVKVERARLMALPDLKHLADKSRARLERITQRASDLDKRGGELEVISKRIFDDHEKVLSGVEDHIKGIDQFNSDMKAQLGNESQDTQRSQQQSVGDKENPT